MKRIALPLFLLMFSAVSHLAAQSTFTITNAPITGNVHVSAVYLSASDLVLTGEANEVNWVSGGGDTSCGTPGGNGSGFIFLTLAGSTGCLNAISYKTAGRITVNGCSGPASGTMDFSEPGGQVGILTTYFSYYKGRYGCYGEIVGGSLTY